MANKDSSSSKLLNYLRKKYLISNSVPIKRNKLFVSDLMIMLSILSALLISSKKMRPLKKHSSYITHIDFSVDGGALHSNCGAYELLFWDMNAGK